MPSGGPRPGSGRPTKAQAAEKARLLAETIKRGPKVLPRQYLQGLLDSPGSSKSERLRAAELLLKLAPEAPFRSSEGASNSGATGIETIICIPRGVQIAKDGKTLIWPATGEVAEPLPFEPFKATPDWTRTAQRDRRAEPEPIPFEVTEAEVPENLVRMDTYKHKRDDEGDQGPAGAA